MYLKSLNSSRIRTKQSRRCCCNRASSITTERTFWPDVDLTADGGVGKWLYKQHVEPYYLYTWVTRYHTFIYDQHTVLAFPVYRSEPILIDVNQHGRLVLGTKQMSQMLIGWARLAGINPISNTCLELKLKLKDVESEEKEIKIGTPGTLIKYIYFVVI